MKKRFSVLILLVFLSVALLPALGAEEKTRAETLDHYTPIRPLVDIHTQEEIFDFFQSHPIVPDSTENRYRKNPEGPVLDGSDTYSPGLLSVGTINSALNAVNLARYIAGLNADVVNAPEMEEAVAASALVNALNGSVSHDPDRPSKLTDPKYDLLFNLAQKGASSSNLHGVSTLDSIIGENTYMSDSDSGNIDRVGHRRWVLNPDMGKTAFGQCDVDSRSYSAMYAFDDSGTGRQSFVCWPGQQMPVDYFDESNAWSVSYGESLNPSKIRVTLTRQSDGRTWNFSSSGSDGYFNVENSWYGQPGCVIFRPDGVGSYHPGDVFDVTIVNSDTMTVLDYSVTFFSLAEEPAERLPGDANGDGVVDLVDAMLVLRYTCGWGVTVNLTNSDMNGDGEVDLTDAMRILRATCG